MKATPRNRKIIVFTVPERSKIQGSILFKPKARTDMFSRCEEFWVLQPAPDCRDPWPVGQKGYISDAFELEPTNLNLWEEHASDPTFQALKAFSDEVAGDVVTQIIHEDSVLAIED